MGLRVREVLETAHDFSQILVRVKPHEDVFFKPAPLQGFCRQNVLVDGHSLPKTAFKLEKVSSLQLVGEHLVDKFL